MKNDICDRADIELLVNTFYNKVRTDQLIGPVFEETAKINWPAHLSKMYDFWESILFGKATYKGNPMLAHFQINHLVALDKVKFDTWKNIFFNTTDQLFEGENAELIKQKAQSIADLMEFKINSHSQQIRIV